MVTKEKIVLEIKDICCILLDRKPEVIKLYTFYPPNSEEGMWLYFVYCFKNSLIERFPNNRNDIKKIFNDILFGD